VQPDTNIQDNTWYNSANPESKVISGWTKLLQRYKTQWNVFAVDIKVQFSLPLPLSLLRVSHQWNASR
jgi:hypothetical protein